MKERQIERSKGIGGDEREEMNHREWENGNGGEKKKQGYGKGRVMGVGVGSWCVR